MDDIWTWTGFFFSNQPTSGYSPETQGRVVFGSLLHVTVLVHTPYLTLPQDLTEPYLPAFCPILAGGIEVDVSGMPSSGH